MASIVGVGPGAIPAAHATESRSPAGKHDDERQARSVEPHRARSPADARHRCVRTGRTPVPFRKTLLFFTLLGTVIPEGTGLELLGRLPQPESLIILGRDLERVRTPADLVCLRIGIGPAGSGTEQIVRRLLAQVPELRLQVSTQTIDRHLDMLASGELELGAMVIDEGAALVHDAVARRRLQMLDLPGAPALARRLPFVRAGRIEAGQIDYVRGCRRARWTCCRWTR